MTTRKILLVLLVFVSSLGMAQIRLPNVLGENMVLQRNKPVSIWGWADNCTDISVSFAGQTKTCKTGERGLWEVSLDSMKASADPKDLIIRCAVDTIILKNILVGDVWLCSGQSNMEYTLYLRGKYKAPAKGENIAHQECLSANFPDIRHFRVEKDLNYPDVVTSGWYSCVANQSIKYFSAIAYFYGKELYQNLHIPIGIISSSWGGKKIEDFTSKEAYLASPVFADEMRDSDKIDDAKVGLFFARLIEPLAPYTLKGFLWYQGESNCMINETRYVEKMEVMVDSWRNHFRGKDLPFYSVQIAPYYYTKRKDKEAHTAETLPLFWEQQTRSLKIPNTGMVVTTDLVDDLSDIHPPYKWIVASRLAKVALAQTYKQNIEYSGPVYKKLTISKDKIILEFDHIGNGLMSSDGNPLTWFTIAGADKQFKPALATIEGDKVVVSCAEIKKPVAVRFAWHEEAQPNFFNKSGLPAVPFRTDAQ